MHRMRKPLLIIALGILAIGHRLESEARGDLIRANSKRSFPSIAGDIVGSQTYTYDPSTRTGTFELVNAPHLIKLGPGADRMVPLGPDLRGSLYQSLLMKLDRNGRLVEGPGNRFEIRGTVVIGEKTYEGVLLSGRPIAFGAEAARSGSSKDQAFDLDVRIDGGALAETFGTEAYLRINAYANSTFSGVFDTDFSSDRPRTSLRAVPNDATPVPEPTAFVMLLTTGAGVVALRLRSRLRRGMLPPRGEEPTPTTRPLARMASTITRQPLSQPGVSPTACPGPHSRSAAPARGSVLAIRQSP